MTAKFVLLFSVYFFLTIFSVFPQDKILFGKASFYAQKFDGTKTASGETYTNDQLTAAHPDLPFNTLVRITNLDNMKSTVVKINDRCVEKNNRIIQVSYAAAEKLGMLQKGIVDVKMEAMLYEVNNDEELKNKSKSGYVFNMTVNTSPPSGYGIQMGMFQNVENLSRMLQKLDNINGFNVLVYIDNNFILPRYKVIIGPFTTYKAATDYRQRIPQIYGISDIDDSFIVNLTQITQ